MADKRISDFSALETLQDEDVLLVSSEGETYKLAAAIILDFIVRALTAFDVSMEGYASYVPREGQDIPDISYSDTVMEAIRKLRAMLRFEKTTAAMQLDGYEAPASTLRPAAVVATDTINIAIQKIAAFLAQHDNFLRDITDDLNALTADDVSMHGYTPLVPRTGESVPAITSTDSVLDAIRKAVAVLNYERTTATQVLTGYTAPNPSGSGVPQDVTANDTINVAFQKVVAFINQLNTDFDELPDMTASNVTMDGYTSLVPREGQEIPDILPEDTVLLAIRKLRAMLRFEKTTAAMRLDGYEAPEEESDAPIEDTDTVNEAFAKAEAHLGLLDIRTYRTERALAEYIVANNAFQVAYNIREYGMRNAFKLFCTANAPLVGLDQAVLRFFAAASATVTETYTSAFYLYTTSLSPVGWKKDDNYGLVCEPSTNETAGRDDYADLPLFACFDCNYTIDSTTREPVISAVKGVYGNFSSAPANSFVGVLQMTGWVRRSIDATTKTVEYAAYRKDAGFKPLPEAVRASDNSVRPFVIHAKYAAGVDVNGKLGSFSGAVPAARRSSATDIPAFTAISHDGQIAKWRAVGAQYCGAGLCDYAFLQTMLEIKYANLGSANVMKGCRDYNFSLSAAVEETGVKRVLVASAQANELLVGSAVSVGTVTDRANSRAYGTVGYAAIASITEVEIDGTPYKAINLAVDSTFDTASNTKLLTQPWFTGSTDNVRGNDGSPFDNQSGKEPFKLQGIEVMIGAFECVADTLLTWDGDGFVAYSETAAADIASSAPSANAIEAARVAALSSKQFVAELNPTAGQEGYMFATVGGASSSTGYCASQTRAAIGSGSLQIVMLGTQGAGDGCGFAFITAEATNTTNWNRTCRACGTGGNRGVYTESAGSLG